MCTTGYFEVLSCDTKLNDNTIISGGCKYTSDYKQDKDNKEHRNYCRTFKPDETIKFTREKPDGLNKWKFYYKINTTEAEVNILGVALISIELSSPS